jgi:hypothetical protein
MVAKRAAHSSPIDELLVTCLFRDQRLTAIGAPIMLQRVNQPKVRADS